MMQTVTKTELGVWGGVWDFFLNFFFSALYVMTTEKDW